MRKEMVLYFIIYGFTDFVSFEYNHDLLAVKYKNIELFLFTIVFPRVIAVPRLLTFLEQSPTLTHVH